ncbi:hypothetical protein [Chryseobacterium sp.]|uniref:hypothetical protein n=1 Tax=Chryseobacterium sp. TaxID=1871047 RepID=UPI000EE334A6|nr:hypothetical protein [Chryseobacterium sp.]HCA07790.1 hypothetical protein [Chryseobacterium sp.]
MKINDYQDVITKFDRDITMHVESLKEHISDIRFDTENAVCFTLSDDFDSSLFLKKEKKQGLYMFELNLDTYLNAGVRRKTRIKNFAQAWKKKKQDSFFSSSTIQKRLKVREVFKEQWLPIYIGKNKNIYCRIREHIDLSPQKQTYAMKLKHRTNLHGLEFRVSTIELDVKNYDFIVPYVEKSLREEYHPIIGKQ